MLRDNANSWRPIAPPTNDPSVDSLSSATSATVSMPCACSFSAVFDADAPEPAHRQRMQEREFPVRRYQQQAVGLGFLAGDLGQELGASDADGDGQPDAVADLRAQPRGDLDRGARHPP